MPGLQREPLMKEHIDSFGVLNVPVFDRNQRGPDRPGWEPFWVSTKLGGGHLDWEGAPEKIVRYRKLEQ
jgi:hypothetical protein